MILTLDASLNYLLYIYIYIYKTKFDYKLNFSLSLQLYLTIKINITIYFKKLTIELHARAELGIFALRADKTIILICNKKNQNQKSKYNIHTYMSWRIS